MTYEEAIQQIKEQIETKGKFSVSNIPDYALGLLDKNKQQLQHLLNSFLDKKGVLNPEDELAINALMKKQQENRKERAKIIVRDIGVAVLTFGGIVGVYFLTKKKK